MQRGDTAEERASASARIDVDPRKHRVVDAFADPILRALVAAQANWLARRDARELRRELVALLGRVV